MDFKPYYELGNLRLLEDLVRYGAEGTMSDGLRRIPEPGLKEKAVLLSDFVLRQPDVLKTFQAMSAEDIFLFLEEKRDLSPSVTVLGKILRAYLGL